MKEFLDRIDRQHALRGVVPTKAINYHGNNIVIKYSNGACISYNPSHFGNIKIFLSTLKLKYGTQIVSFSETTLRSRRADLI